MDGPGKRWKFAAGDVNGFLGLVVDNLAVLALLAAVLIGAGVPSDIVFGRMFPGTAMGVLVGDLMYTWMAVRLGRRSGRTDVTAMPFGLDTPSTIGMAVLVLGPAFAKFRAAGLDPTAAGLETWHLGMAATIIMGAVKSVLAFAGRSVRRLVPRAGLLGSLAGIAMMLIGFLPLLELLQTPIVGFLTLGLVLYALVAKGKIPGGVPGVLFAVAVGTLAYYALGRCGLAGVVLKAPVFPALRFALPHPDRGVLQGFAHVTPYLPLIVPFALLTVVGGVNNTESARVAGDDYDVRDILLVEAAATLLAGLAGGVAQTTPYIGHPAYKQMGARTNYTLLTGVFVGVGGMLGYLSDLIELIPMPVLAPVLVFLSVTVVVQAFSVVPPRHAPAVALSFFPAIARLVTIELSDPRFLSPGRFAQLLLGQPGDAAPPLALLVALGNGFIITATLWAAFVVEMTESKLRTAAAYLLAGATFTFFGVIHSVRADGAAYVWWRLSGSERNLSAQLWASYVTVAAAMLLLSLQRQSARRDPGTLGPP